MAAEVEQLVRRMDQALAGLNNRVNDQNERLNHMAAAAHNQPRFRVQFDTFSFEGPDPQADFDNFEQNVRCVIAAMNYPYPEVCNVIVGQMRGTAAQMVRDIVGNYQPYPDLNAFLNRLRQIFVSPAYREKARVEFETRIQKETENTVIYHGAMRALWQRAFPVAERQEQELIRRFIAGLRNRKVNEGMHLLNIANYREAIQEAMRLEATYEIINIEAKRRQNGGVGMLPNTTATGNQAGAQAEPMEIGNLSMQQRNKKGYNNKNQGQRKNYSSSNYRNKGYQGQNYQRKPFDKNKPKRNQMEVNNVNKDECLECGGKGHWAYECTTKQKKQKFRNSQNNQRQNYSGNKGRFQNNKKFQKNNFQKSNKVINNLGQHEESYSETEAKNANSGAQFHQ